MVRGMFFLSFFLLAEGGVVLFSSFPGSIHSGVWVVVCILVFRLGLVVYL